MVLQQRPSTTPGGVPARARTFSVFAQLDNKTEPEFGNDESKRATKRAEKLLGPIAYAKSSRYVQTASSASKIMKDRAATAQLSADFPTETLAAYKNVLDGSILKPGSSEKQSKYEKWLGLDKVKLMSLEELDRVEPSSVLPEEMQDYLVISKDLATKVDGAVRLLRKSSIDDDVFNQFDPAKLDMFVQQTRVHMNSAVRHLLDLLPEFVSQLSVYQTSLNHIGEQKHEREKAFEKMQSELKDVVDERKKLISQVKFLKDQRKNQTRRAMAAGLRDPDGTSTNVMEPDPDWNAGDNLNDEEKVMDLQRKLIAKDNEVTALEQKMDRMLTDQVESSAARAKNVESKHSQVVLDLNKAIKAKDFELDVLTGRLEHALQQVDRLEAEGARGSGSGSNSGGFNPGGSVVRREANELGLGQPDMSYGRSGGIPVMNDVDSDASPRDEPTEPLSPASQARKEQERRERQEERRSLVQQAEDGEFYEQQEGEDEFDPTGTLMSSKSSHGRSRPQAASRAGRDVGGRKPSVREIDSDSLSSDVTSIAHTDCSYRNFTHILVQMSIFIMHF